MKITLHAMVATLLALVLPAAAADDESPFMIDKRDFKKQIKTIALSPVDASTQLKMPESAARTIEEEVTKHLEKRGFTVIPTATLAAIRETMEAQVGGLEDPATGDIDAAKREAVRSHASRELWFQHEFDAIGRIRVAMYQAPFEKDRAEWDGVKQKIENKGRNKDYSGKIFVSSVSFEVYDQTNKLMYLSYGGLEVLQSRSDAQLIPLPVENYFSDEKKIRKAAQIAMKPI